MFPSATPPPDFHHPNVVFCASGSLFSTLFQFEEVLLGEHWLRAETELLSWLTVLFAGPSEGKSPAHTSSCYFATREPYVPDTPNPIEVPDVPWETWAWGLGDHYSGAHQS